MIGAPKTRKQTHGESDLVNARMRRHRGTTDSSVRIDAVEGTGGVAGLLDQLAQLEGRERSELGRLEDDGAAGSESGRDLPGPL